MRPFFINFSSLKETCNF